MKNTTLLFLFICFLYSCNNSEKESVNQTETQTQVDSSSISNNSEKTISQVVCDGDGPDWGKVLKDREYNKSYLDQYIIDDRFKNGLPEGKCVILGKNEKYGMDHEFEVKNGVIQGLYRRYYKMHSGGKGDRCLSLVAKVVDGCYDGYYTEYWLSGTLPEEPYFLKQGNYKQGKQDGIWESSDLILNANHDIMGYYLKYIHLYRLGKFIDKIQLDKNGVIVDNGSGILIESEEYKEYLNNNLGD